MKSNYNYLVKLIKSVGLQKMKVNITTTINLLSTNYRKTLKTFKKAHWGLDTAKKMSFTIF